MKHTRTSNYWIDENDIYKIDNMSLDEKERRKSAFKEK